MPSKITKFGKKFGDIYKYQEKFFLYENDSLLKKQKKNSKAL